MASQTTKLRAAIAKSLGDVPGKAAVEVDPAPIEYAQGQSMGGGAGDRAFIVRLLVGFPDDADAQAALDELLDDDGPKSVRAALEADPKLDGEVADLTVTRCSGYRTFTRSDGQVLGAEWAVRIIPD